MDVRWTFFVQLKRIEKAVRMLQQLERKMDVELMPQHVERYWKDHQLVVITAWSDSHAVSIEMAVFNILVAAQHVGRDWMIQGPSEFANHQWAFSGWSNRGSLPGLRHLAFDLTERESASTHVVHFMATDTW